MITREPQGRTTSETRPITIELNVNKYAEGSVLIKVGNTHVLCTASVDENVPPWLKGQGQGWVTGEYNMLPRATHTRNRRERDKVSGRTQEIQRLIGRALRSMVNLKALGERTVTIDCDVLQADGGTRTTSITGGCLALTMALKKLEKCGKISKEARVDTVAAVSVGIKDHTVLVDLDYSEDSSCEVDMNFVVTGKGLFVEVQGTAEKQAFSKDDLNKMTESALSAIENIKQIQLQTLEKLDG